MWFLNIIDKIARLFANLRTHDSVAGSENMAFLMIIAILSPVKLLHRDKIFHLWILAAGSGYFVVFVVDLEGTVYVRTPDFIP